MLKLLKNQLKGKGASELNPRVISHYGIPSTASRLAYDPIQQLLAVGTRDGRIKVVGSDTIEGLLTSPKEAPFKHLEFLQNQGFLISISNGNDIQVWDLEHRCIASNMEWKSSISAFAVIPETTFMYLGDISGLVTVLKYDISERKLLQQLYTIPIHSVSEGAGITLHNHQSVVAILPQPCSCGNRQDKNYLELIYLVSWVLLAYDNGVLVLWDVSIDNPVVIRGYNAETGSNEEKNKKSDDNQEIKQILSLCWASLDGSILAVGYTNGDILFWNLSCGATANDKNTGKSADNVVKLELPSLNKNFLSFFNGTTKKRSPVIGLHWSSSILNTDHGGHLFVYGGDEIGSPEVLAILSLEWSPQKESLKNVLRVNINLQESFLDMVLLHSFSVLENTEAASLLILSSPSELHFYDSSCVSGLILQKDKSSPIPIHYRSAVRTNEPNFTVGKFILLNTSAKSTVALLEMAAKSGIQGGDQSSDKVSKWPLNGGVPCHLTPSREKNIERLYIAGFQDGSVRLWDATYPVLSPLLTLDPEVKSVTVTSVTSPVSALDFSSETLHIAVGSDNGLVRLYNISGNYNENKLHVVTETNSEDYDRDQEKESPLSDVFQLSASPVFILRFRNLGGRLAVGYGNGQVAMLNVKPSSVLFLIDALPNQSSPVTSFASALFQNASDQSESHGHSEPAKELTVVLRSDLHIAVLDSSNGDVISNFTPKRDKESTAISLYVLDGAKYLVDVSEAKHMHFLPQKNKKKKEKIEGSQISDHIDRNWDGFDRSANSGHSSLDFQILLCCTDVILLYSLKSVIQGDADCINEVNLLETSCWTAIFKKDKKECGLIVVHRTGSIEIRSLPNLELLGGLSLMPILRWNFKTNMVWDKSLSSTENGQIALVNGCELAIVSLLTRDNDFRIPQSLPCLHDKALAAALDMNFSPTKKKNKQSGIWGGLVSGLKVNKESKESHPTEPEVDPNSIQSCLDKIFSRSPTSPSEGTGDVIQLNIDDIKIDGPPHTDNKNETKKKEKKNNRKKLFGGSSATSESKPPKQRTIDEIKGQYRKDNPAVTSAHSAALEARNKLIERQEKLEKIALNSEELAHGSEDFASMAKELARRQKNRKWWQL